MKVLFASLPIHYLDNMVSMNTAPSTALYLLSSVLENKGHEVKILDPIEVLKGCNTEETYRKLIYEYIKNTEIICFSSNTMNWAMTRLAIDFVKDYQDEICRKIIVGGIHPSFFQREIMESTLTDYILRGEGEITLPRLLEAIENKSGFENIEGLAWRKDDKVIINNSNASISISEYEELPIPNYNLMPEGVYSIFPIESSRGCSFACKFCSIPGKNNWKAFSEKCVIERSNLLISKFQNKFTSNQVYLTDDCFTNSIERANEILNGLVENNKLTRYIVETRATDMLKNNEKEAIELFGKKEINRIATGVECGYDSGLKKIKKGLTLEQLENSMNMLDKHDIIGKAYYSFIIGFPWESIDDCISTIDYAASIVKRYGKGLVNVNWLWLFPSQIWKERKEYGIHVEHNIFDGLGFGFNKRTFNLTHPNLSESNYEYLKEKIEEYEEEGIMLRNS